MPHTGAKLALVKVTTTCGLFTQSLSPPTVNARAQYQDSGNRACYTCVFNMYHALVTGGGGYLGTKLCKGLSRLGYRVTAYDVHFVDNEDAEPEPEIERIKVRIELARVCVCACTQLLDN